MEHSWILIVAMIGHVLCVCADRLLLCGDLPALGRAFRTGGGGNDAASRVGLRVQPSAAVSCAGAV